jgi:hypothetical protein
VAHPGRHYEPPLNFAAALEKVTMGVEAVLAAIDKAVDATKAEEMIKQD